MFTINIWLFTYNYLNLYMHVYLDFLTHKIQRLMCVWVVKNKAVSKQNWRLFSGYSQVTAMIIKHRNRIELYMFLSRYFKIILISHKTYF